VKPFGFFLSFFKLPSYPLFSFQKKGFNPSVSAVFLDKNLGAENITVSSLQGFLEIPNTLECGLGVFLPSASLLVYEYTTASAPPRTQENPPTPPVRLATISRNQRRSRTASWLASRSPRQPIVKVNACRVRVEEARMDEFLQIPLTAFQGLASRSSSSSSSSSTSTPSSVFGISAEKWRTEFRRNDAKGTLTESFSIKLSNGGHGGGRGGGGGEGGEGGRGSGEGGGAGGGEQRVTEVCVEETLGRASEWTIDRTSHGLTSQGARGIRFVVRIPPASEELIHYTITYSYPSASSTSSSSVSSTTTTTGGSSPNENEGGSFGSSSSASLFSKFFAGSSSGQDSGDSVPAPPLRTSSFFVVSNSLSPYPELALRPERRPRSNSKINAENTEYTNIPTPSADEESQVRPAFLVLSSTILSSYSHDITLLSFSSFSLKSL
jgi:hypothetical protein